MRTFLLSVAASAVVLGAPSAAFAETLSVAIPAQEMGTLDPHKTASLNDKPVISWVYSGLTRFKPGSVLLSEIEPDLAESWDVSEDGKSWTFHLRKGVQFHDGYGEVTADDVVFSLKRAIDPQTSSFAGEYSAVEDVVAVDTHTVRIDLKQPVSWLLGLVANYHGGNIVSKAAVEKLGDDFRVHPVGTGPFKFLKYNTGESIELVRNEDYFRGKPKLDGIVFRYIPSDAARDLAFTSGEVDMIYGRQDRRWIERMKGTEGVVLHAMKPAEMPILHLNTTKAPLDNPKVREAVAYAVDREQVAAFIHEDVAVPSLSVVQADYLGAVTESIVVGRDVAKAKELLAEAGFPDGVTIKSVQSSLPTLMTTAQIVQAQLAEAGIKLEFDVVDHSTYHAQIRQDLSGLTLYSAARFPVADTILTQFFHSASTVNTPTAVTNFSHCDVADTEIDEARVAPTEEEAVALWQEAQRKIIDANCAVPLVEQPLVWIHTDKVKLGYDLKGSMNLAPILTEESDKE